MRLEELDAAILRIAERREYAQQRSGPMREALESDTDMLEWLVGRCRALIIANGEIHKLLDELTAALHARPVLEVEKTPGKRVRKKPEAGAAPGSAATNSEPERLGDRDDLGGALLRSARADSPVRHWICRNCSGDRVTLDGLPPGIECRCGRSDAWALKPAAPQPLSET